MQHEQETWYSTVVLISDDVLGRYGKVVGCVTTAFVRRLAFLTGAPRRFFSWILIPYLTRSWYNMVMILVTALFKNCRCEK